MIRDVMQSAGLHGYAQLGLIIFTLSFAMIVAVAVFGRSRSEEEELLSLPLNPEDEGVVGDKLDATGGVCG